MINTLNFKELLKLEITCKWAWLSVFALAMGFMESSVVVYLRALLYPGGFAFPLVPIPPLLFGTEVAREASTLVMLAAVAFLWGKCRMERLGAFLWSFAVWDLAYYLFLYLILDWPLSRGTWDVLFLIPLPWVGPVWAPCVLSVIMAPLAVVIFSQSPEKPMPFLPSEWVALLLGSAISVGAFLWPALSHSGFSESLSNPEMPENALDSLQSFIPENFPYVLFSGGIAFLLFGVGSYTLRALKRGKLRYGQLF